jgi:eukaryotic-like serine/threonine-protein kinase
MIALSCPFCLGLLEVEESSAGKKVQCPHCRQMTEIPAAALKVGSVGTFAADATVLKRPATSEQDGTDPPSLMTTMDAVLKPKVAHDHLVDAEEFRELLAAEASYAVEGEVARGGMGAIMRAVDKSIRREVAVKFLLDHANDRMKARFVEEAQITGQLEHPNIVPIHQLGATSDGRCFFSMKMVKGRSLAQKLKDANSQGTLGRMLNIFVGICNATAYAHSRQVIHRDLKPANIMVGDFGEVYVMDWGLAKVLNEEETSPPAAPSTHGQRMESPIDEMSPEGPIGTRSGDRITTNRHGLGELTQAGAVVGTPAYMSPEQARGEEMDPRADIYSLGAILYEIMTLTPPAGRGGDKLAILKRAIEGQIDPPDTRSPERARAGWIPREVSAIAMKALAPRPTDRYQTVEALRRDVELFLEGRSVSAKQDSAWEIVKKLVKRNKGASIVAAIGIAALTAVVAVSFQFINAARVQAENDRTIAEVERGRAEGQRQEAEDERNLANAERAKADEARRNAELAEQERSKQLWLSERLLYDVQFREALSHFSNNDLVSCRLALDVTRKDLRGPEYGYLIDQVRRKARVIAAHGSPVTSLQLSATGRRMYSASRDGVIKVWDADSSQELRALAGHNSSISDLAASRDGKRLFSRDAYSTVKVWDTETGKEIETLFAHPNAQILRRTGMSANRCLALSPDGKRLAAAIGDSSFLKGAPAASGPEVKVWDLDTGKEAIALPMSDVGSIAFSPDGKRLFAASNSRKKGTDITAWDLATGKPGLTLHRTYDITNMAFSPDGTRLFMTGAIMEIDVVNLETSKATYLTGHKERVESLILSTDGKRMFTGSYDGIIKIWDLDINREIMTLRGRASGVASLALSVDGKRLDAGGHDGKILVWNLADTENKLPMIGPRHGATILRWLAAPDGKRMFSGSADHTIKVWDLEGKRPNVTLRGHKAEIRGLALAPDGKRLFSLGGDIRIWDLDSGKQISTLPGPMLPARSDSSALALIGPGALALTPGGKQLVWSGQDDITVWDLDAGKKAYVLSTPKAVNCLTVSVERQLCSAHTDLSIKLWDLGTGNELRTLRGHTRGGGKPNRIFLPAVHALALSQDGKRVFSAGSDQTVKVWDTQTGAEILTLRGHTDEVMALAVVPGGKRLFSAGKDETVILWDLELGRQLLALRGHSSWVLALALVNDAKRLIVASNELRSWGFDSNEP